MNDKLKKGFVLFLVVWIMHAVIFAFLLVGTHDVAASIVPGMLGGLAVTSFYAVILACMSAIDWAMERRDD